MARSSAQLGLPLKPRVGWGGARRNAGRKPKSAKAGMPHSARPALASRYPVHVTLRVVAGIRSMRGKPAFRQIKNAVAVVAGRPGFRLVHFSVQSNHLHLLVEAKDAQALSRGVRALEISVAQRLNRLSSRKGRFFADRYHARALKSPREVRHALAYVLLNANHHSGFGSARPRGPDFYSSGCAFNGWKAPPRGIPEDIPLVASPKTWLLLYGWRTRGLLAFDEIPGRR